MRHCRELVLVLTVSAAASGLSIAGPVQQPPASASSSDQQASDGYRDWAYGVPVDQRARACSGCIGHTSSNRASPRPRSIAGSIIEREGRRLEAERWNAFESRLRIRHDQDVTTTEGDFFQGQTIPVLRFVAERPLDIAR